MGLDEFSSDDDDSIEDDWESSKAEASDEVGDDDFPTPAQMGRILRHHALEKDVGIEVDERQLKGSAEDFGMLFALMFLDYPDADPYSLEEPE